MKIITASQNPVKIKAVTEGFKKMFSDQHLEVVGVNIPSGVSDQPFSDTETWQGAFNRAQGAKKAYPDADYWVGVEGGIEEKDGRMEAFAWIVVLSDKGTGQARTAAFALPPRVVSLIHEGIELGEADDIVFGSSNSKQKSGAIGLLTQNRITRETLYMPAVMMALIPFLNEELYFEEGIS